VLIKLFITIALLFLCSCVTIKEPQPEDTRFDESKRDWLEVYRAEIKAAVDNEDEDAYHFFMREYIEERVRLWKLEKAKKKDM
jgi:hypothetical protein